MNTEQIRIAARLAEEAKAKATELIAKGLPPLIAETQAANWLRAKRIWAGIDPKDFRCAFCHRMHPEPKKRRQLKQEFVDCCPACCRSGGNTAVDTSVTTSEAR